MRLARNVNASFYLETTRHSTEHNAGVEGGRPSSQDTKTLQRPENRSPWIFFFFKLFFNITDTQCGISHSNSKKLPQVYFYEAEG